MPKETQLAFNFRPHGGLRKKAGRKRFLECDPKHTMREKIDARTPAHITLKLIAQTPNLRTPEFIKEFARAVKRAQKHGLRIQQFTIDSNHIHLIAETDDNRRMTSGMISLKTSIVWALRRIFMFHGKIFVGRYHMRLINTPTEMRNLLKYVLFNHAHHCKSEIFADVYSTLLTFKNIELLIKEKLRGQPARWQKEVADCLSEARSWMQTQGWTRAR